MTAVRERRRPGSAGRAGGASDPRPRSDHADGARILARIARVLTDVHEYASPCATMRARDAHACVCDGRGRPAAELHVIEAKDAADGRGRARAVCITSRSARRTRRSIMPGRSDLTELRHPQQRRDRPLLFPQPVFPRAQRHPVRDRHRRPGLCDRRADGKLGEKLALPPFLEPRRTEIEAGLKPIG